MPTPIVVTPVTPESLGFIGGFGPAEPPPDVNGYQGSPSITETKNEPETIKETKPDIKVVDKQATKVDTQPTKSLADVLREDREDKARRNRESQNQIQTTNKVKELENEIAQLKSNKAFEDDPIGYFKSKKLSNELQLAIGKQLLYDLAPDKAPPELRFQLFEAKAQRDRESQENARRESEAKHNIETTKNNIEAFANSLGEAAKGFQVGTYPESESWFTNEQGDVDHTVYRKSLLATAANLAKSADEQGRIADLSPRNVAKVLETELAKRQSIRDAKRNKSTPAVSNKVQTVNNNSGKAVDTLSTRGLNTGGPDTPAVTEAERIRRAIAAGFGS